MIKNKITSCLVLMSAVFAIGCSSSGGSGAPAGGGVGGGMGIAAAVNGTWFRPCVIDDVNIDLSDGVYEVTTLTFNGNSYTSTILSYQDDACTTPSNPHELILSGTIAFPGGIEITEQGEASFIDITTTGATLDGVPPPVEGLFPITDYDIILVTDSTLFTGFYEDEDAGESPATRPTSLDTEYTFTRI